MEPPSPNQAEPRWEGEKCGISDLPNEVLTEIFSYVCSASNCVFSRCSDHLSLSLVCKRWRENSERSMFRAFEFSLNGPHLVKQSRKLLSIVERNPGMATYLQDIQVFIGSYEKEMVPNLLPVLERGVQLRCIGLCFNFSDATAPLIQAIKRLPRLEYLTLDITYPQNPTLPLVLEFLTLIPSLRRLKVLRCNAYEPYDLQELLRSRTRPGFISQSELEQLLPPSRYRTGNLTSLEIDRVEIPPYVMEHLLRWPTGLTRISLRFFHRLFEYPNDELLRILSMHQDSLKFIRLGRSRTLDFSNFSYLEELRISWYVMRVEKPSDAIKNLPLANLRYLRLDVSETDTRFAEDDVKWMDQFASILGTQHPQSTLKRVSINFLFEFDLHRDFIPYKTQLDEWPCEYAEKAIQCMKRYGINLEFDPFWTRDEWNGMMKKKWSEREPGPCEISREEMAQMPRTMIPKK